MISISELIVEKRMAYAAMVPLLLTAILTISVLSCHDFGADSVFNYNLAGVRVQVADSSIYLTNGTNDTIYYFTVERGTAAFISWRATCDTSNAVTVNNTKDIPYSKVYGYYQGSEIIIFWWHCTVRSTGGLEPNSIHAMVIDTM